MATDELREIIDRRGGIGDVERALPRLVLQRSTQPREVVPQCVHPTLCLVLQGKKVAYASGQQLTYDPGHFLISFIEMPMANRVVTASRSRPYLGLALELDLEAIAATALRMGIPPAPRSPISGVMRAPADAHLLDAIRRYVVLLDEPEGIPYLAHAIESEIWYRLLSGPAARALAQLAFDESTLARVGRATALLRERYAEPLSIAVLASLAAMSRTTFHDAFRQVTGTTPRQYQKLVRLQEARRLLGMAHTTAAQVAFDVGYASPSHFSRDYRKFFGISPAADMHSALDNAPTRVRSSDTLIAIA
jgi:AraC-like DNA-binding protein